MTADSVRPMLRIWYNARFRGILLQLVTLSMALGLLFLVVDNTLEHLASRGIVSGFAFLWSTAGFGIIMHLIDYSEQSTYARAFVVGLLNTCVVAGLGIASATVLGLVLGVIRLSGNWLMRNLALLYVEIVRNIPLLLQIFVWYFAILVPLPSPRQSFHIAETIFLNNRGLYIPRPTGGESAYPLMIVTAAAIGIVLLSLGRRKHRGARRFISTTRTALLFVMAALMLSGLVWGSLSASWEKPVLQGFNYVGGLVLIPEFVALWLALSTYTAAYIAEIVRAGIQSVNRGQIEAAYALGLRRFHVLRFVVLPQALRVIIPPLTGQYLNLTKNSSLGVAIAYPELVSVFAGTVLNQTGQAIEVIAITMAVYLSLSLLISLLMNWFNRRVTLTG